MATFIKIASVEVGSGGVATIDFTSIPQTYTDLVILVSLRDDRAAAYANSTFISFNGNTANFSARAGYGTGTASGSFTLARYAGTNVSEQATASIFSNSQIYISNYTSSLYKSYSVESVTENNGSAGYQYFAAGLWSDTSAITSIGLTLDTGSGGSVLKQYSTATLYGILKA